MRKGKTRLFPRYDGDKFVAALYRSGILADARVLICPATKDDNQNGEDLGGSGSDPRAEVEPGTVSYGASRHGRGSPMSITKLRMKKVPTTQIPLVWDKKGNHEGYLHVLFLDGHVQQCSEEEFRERFGHYE